MESIMQKLKVIIKNVFSKEKVNIVCPCGYKTTIKRRAMKHLNKHKLSIGSIDYSTGMIIW